MSRPGGEFRKLDIAIYQKMLNALSKGPNGNMHSDYIAGNIKFGQGRQILHYISEWVMHDKHRQAMLANRELVKLQCTSIDNIDDAMTEFLKLSRPIMRTGTSLYPYHTRGKLRKAPKDL